MKYYLDVETIIQQLGQHSALLRATLPRKQQVVIHVQKQRIIECTILNEYGSVIASGEQAFKAVADHEEWEVEIQTARHVEPPAPVPPPTMPPPPSNTTQLLLPDQTILHRISESSDRWLLTYPVREQALLRTILNLVDGRRSIAQIKRQVIIAPEVVNDIIALLYKGNLITYY